MSLIQSRTKRINQLFSTHNRLVNYFGNVEQFEESNNFRAMAFSARINYEKIFLAITRQVLEASPIFFDSELALRMSPEHSVLETAFGFSIAISGQDDSNYFIDGYNSPEASENILILKAAAQADIFFDIGANLGYYSFLVAQSRQSDIRCYAFEPVLDNFRKIQASVRINGFEQVVIPKRVAVGAKNLPDVEIRINRYGSGGNSLIEFSDKLADSKFIENAPLISLDNFIKENEITSKNALLKIDVEGFEEDVIAGARNFLTSNIPPVVIVETFPHNETDMRVLGQLDKWGFSVWGVRKFIPNVPVIYPAFRRNRLVRSPLGNYIAFHHRHTEVLEQCKQPEEESFFLRDRFIRKLEDFQRMTFDSLRRYAERLNETRSTDRHSVLVDLPEWEDLSYYDVPDSQMMSANDFSFWRRLYRKMAAKYPLLNKLKQIWLACSQGGLRSRLYISLNRKVQ